MTIAPIRHSIHVAVPPQRAFELLSKTRVVVTPAVEEI